MRAERRTIDKIKRSLRFRLLWMAVLSTALLTGCAGRGEENGEERGNKLGEWLSGAELDDEYTEEELYQAALSEDTLVVYSVSSRTFRVKEAFERDYPGLSVEVRDIRSADVVDMLKDNYERGSFACDVVICSDCDGTLYSELIKPGIVYTYIPYDIALYLKQSAAEPELDFLGEAMMLFYNTNHFDAPPVSNIWELTEDAYRGRIVMASPLSSFSTYGFCAQVLRESDAFARAYEEYAGEVLDIPEGMTAGGVFLERLGENLMFVNTNDEVLEGVGNSDEIWMGMLISSKLRYRELGYHMAPVTRLTPFSAVYTPNNVALAGGASNINSAKLFIRYLLGGADGSGGGLDAFSTEGAWSVRTDVPDGSSIPLDEIDMVRIDKEYLYENRVAITEFFERLLKQNVN